MDRPATPYSVLIPLPPKILLLAGAPRWVVAGIRPRFLVVLPTAVRFTPQHSVPLCTWGKRISLQRGVPS